MATGGDFHMAIDTRPEKLKSDDRRDNRSGDKNTSGDSGVLAR